MLMNFVAGTSGYRLFRCAVVDNSVAPVVRQGSNVWGGYQSYHLYRDSLLVYFGGDSAYVSTDAGESWSSSFLIYGAGHRSQLWGRIFTSVQNDSCRTVLNPANLEVSRVCATFPIARLLQTHDGLFVARTEHRPVGGALQVRLVSSADGGNSWLEGRLLASNGSQIHRPTELLGVVGNKSSCRIFVRSAEGVLLVMHSSDAGGTWAEERRIENYSPDRIEYVRIGKNEYLRVPASLPDDFSTTISLYDYFSGEVASESLFPMIDAALIQQVVLSLAGHTLRLTNALAVKETPDAPVRIVEDYADYPSRVRSLHGLRGIEPAKPRTIRCVGNRQYMCYDAEGEFYYLRRQDTSYLLATLPHVLLDGGHVLGYYSTPGNSWSSVVAGATSPGVSTSAVDGVALPLQGHSGGFIAMGYMQALRHGSIIDSSLNRTLPYLPHEVYGSDSPEKPTFSASQVKGQWEVLLWYPANRKVVPGPAGIVILHRHDSVLYHHRDGEGDWTRIALPAGMACQSAIVLADGSILASLCSITREAGQPPIQSDLTVQRYDHRTATWTEIEREFYRGPVIMQAGMRRLVAAPDGHIYLGTLHRGIERLAADGRTWLTMGDAGLDTTQVWDFDVAADGEIAVATSKGVFALRPTTGVVNDGSGGDSHEGTHQLDRNRVTLMRLRPTPATTTVTVELLNVDREPSGISSLKIHDLSGRVVADYSDLAQSANGTRHKELRLDVSALDAGTYLLHAVIGSQQPTLKILVVR
jgi:hypothetical protein